ncbi:flagellar biosynthesis protein, FliO [Thermoanaerobacterium thermosaccharolyticum]|uniref:Flagellar biosynthesis protein, FliO n=2 Tax=Thermoanaerobacterium thermosaccharolyticum TaxID=1517 RepID=A0A231VHI1_THETR|nr:flagellar biosynthetic protein FliO [Thermoanaerobacterium thermosaccharolyticum]AGB19048.1 Flagellar biosynthesis protein, FliO [Thermoanaerobacterium thermosaccharolyticum M0795]AST59003.1 flagellar biosynthetic protein [Thermoanaerobacterium thermosaccharolyticum]KAA5807762.1 FliO/MopB family protein [Thermoanaerobacterium thermosaccharolyticum]MBE0068030.1 FliO/MopB family protein [Thermoanaerobacterium thermosaccharolyticum]MBE0227774.1 FliO/MopB family protein [Thermoanaerobacterium t
MSSDSVVFQAVTFLLIFVFVVFLAYYVTAFINKKALNIYKGNNFDIVDHLNLGKDKNLYIIKVCNEYLLFSVTNNSIVYIKTLTADDVKMKDKNSSFKQSLNISLNNLKKLSMRNLGGNEHDTYKKN